MKNNLYITILCSLLLACEKDSTSVLSPATGQGGSTARFTISENHLYLVDDGMLKVFHIENNGALTKADSIDIDFGAETIAVRGNQLFMGADDAMYIYDITSPSHPSFISRYSHLTACDPVVVNGNFAYVTLRVGASCNTAGTNALEIINISDAKNPVLAKSYSQTSPYGLGIDGNTLFVCEGNYGLKIYSVEDPLSIQEIKHYTDIHAYDVIPHQGVVILTGNDGIFQYDYSDLADIKLLSQIKIQ